MLPPLPHAELLQKSSNSRLCDTNALCLEQFDYVRHYLLFTKNDRANIELNILLRRFGLLLKTTINLYQYYLNKIDKGLSNKNVSFYYSKPLSIFINI